jgi:hypothetical protein
VELLVLGGVHVMHDEHLEVPVQKLYCRLQAPL